MALKLPGVIQDFPVQGFGNSCAPLGFVHAKIVDVEYLPVAEHRVTPGDLQDAEAVAQKGISL